MAKKVWTFTLEDGPHTVEMDHDAVWGRKRLRIDGGPPQPLGPPANRFSVDGDYAFRVGPHDCLLTIRNRGLHYAYDLAVDGLSLDTGLRPAAAPPLPAWGWIFVAACCCLLFLGGALGGGLGAAGALACYGVARDPDRPAGLRASLCVGLTLIAWALYFVLAIVFNALFGRH